MTIDEEIERYMRNAEYERTHGNLQGYLNFRQLAEWLKDYKKLLGAIEDIKADVINIADGRQSIKVRSVIKLIDKYTSNNE